VLCSLVVVIKGQYSDNHSSKGVLSGPAVEAAIVPSSAFLTELVAQPSTIV